MKIAPFLFLFSVSVLSAETTPPASGDLAQSDHPERFTVTSPAFGAVGNSVADDTAAIQAAFNACWHHTSPNFGGIVEFPGTHTYIVSSTINAYDGCQIEGSTASSSGGYSPPVIKWNGPATGAAYNITGFRTAANGSPYYFSPAFPEIPGKIQGRTTPYIAIFTAYNNLTAGQWVSIDGLHTSAGMALNRSVLQVSSATSTSFVALVPFQLGSALGAYTDSGTATLASVVIAFDANAHFMQSVSNIAIENMTGVNQSKVPLMASIDFYFGSRIDTGTRISGAMAEGAHLYGFYFPGGGINVDFDKGWRADGAGVAGIYWRIGGSDSFGIANGTVDNNTYSNLTTPTSGGAVILDNQTNCGVIHFTSRNFKMEVGTSITPGLGVFTLYDCPSNVAQQFFLDFENTWVTQASQVLADFNFASIVMSPANDKALVFSAINGQFGHGLGPNTTQAFVGLPALARNNILGAVGWTPLLTYSPSLNSAGIGPKAADSPAQILGDLNIGQLWQYGIQASDLLFSDTAFTALPNGTTLFAGQILAPPAYWNRSGNQRFAFDVVSKTGTTGTPNGGNTRCSGSSRANRLTCSSDADLSAGQRISIGPEDNLTITSVDATRPDAVLVFLSRNLANASSNQALAFSAPVLGPEMQLPTKASSAPDSLAWAQGDMEQNAAATANGVAAWVNVAAATPGRWAGIPLGDSKGKIAASQLSSARSAQAFCAGTASSSTSLLLFGAGTAQTTCTQSPGPQTLQQILLTTPGSLSNLAVRCGHQGSQPSSGSFSVWDLPSGVPMTNAASGTNTGLTVTIGNSPVNANKTLFDTLHRYDYAAGDMIRIQFTTQANETLADCTASVNY